MEITKDQYKKHIWELSKYLKKEGSFYYLIETLSLPELTKMIIVELFDYGVTLENYSGDKNDIIQVLNYRKEHNEYDSILFKPVSMSNIINEKLLDPGFLKEAEKFFNSQYNEVKLDTEKYLRFLDTVDEETVNKFFQWEYQIEKKYYLKGILTESNILSAFIASIPVDESHPLDETFLGCVQTYGKFMVKTYVGQGTFSRIFYNGKEVFTTN